MKRSSVGDAGAAGAAAPTDGRGFAGGAAAGGGAGGGGEIKQEEDDTLFNSEVSMACTALHRVSCIRVFGTVLCVHYRAHVAYFSSCFLCSPFSPFMRSCFPSQPYDLTNNASPSDQRLVRCTMQVQDEHHDAEEEPMAGQ